MTFGQKIKQLRTERGLTQEELAARVGKGKSYICNIEKGFRTTTLDCIPPLAEALNVPIGELMGDDIEPSSPFLEYIPYLAQAEESDLRSIRKILGMPVEEKKNGASVSEAIS